MVIYGVEGDESLGEKPGVLVCVTGCWKYGWAAWCSVWHRVLKVWVRNLVLGLVQDAESVMRNLVFGSVQGAENGGEQRGVWFVIGCWKYEVSKVVLGLVQGAESVGEKSGVWFGTGCWKYEVSSVVFGLVHTTGCWKCGWAAWCWFGTGCWKWRWTAWWAEWCFLQGAESVGEQHHPLHRVVLLHLPRLSHLPAGDPSLPQPQDHPGIRLTFLCDRVYVGFDLDANRHIRYLYTINVF